MSIRLQAEFIIELFLPLELCTVLNLSITGVTFKKKKLIHAVFWPKLQQHLLKSTVLLLTSCKAGTFEVAICNNEQAIEFIYPQLVNVLVLLRDR